MIHRLDKLIIKILELIKFEVFPKFLYFRLSYLLNIFVI